MHIEYCDQCHTRLNESEMPRQAGTQDRICAKCRHASAAAAQQAASIQQSPKPIPASKIISSPNAQLSRSRLKAVRDHAKSNSSSTLVIAIGAIGLITLFAVLYLVFGSNHKDQPTLSSAGTKESGNPEENAQTERQRVETIIETGDWEKYWSATEEYMKAYGSTQVAKEWGKSALARFDQAGPGHENGLLYWLKYDSSQPKQAANAVKGSSGVLQGDAAWTQSKEGAMLSFDKGNGSVDLPVAFLNNRSDWTVAAWVYPVNNSVIFTEGKPEQTFALSISASGAIEVRAWHRDRKANWMTIDSDPGVVPLKRWSLIAVTLQDGGLNRGKCNFYVNGKHVSSAYGLAEFNPDTKFSMIGDAVGAYHGSSQGHNYFQGRVRNLQIYSRALNSAEMQAMTLLWSPDAKLE